MMLYTMEYYAAMTKQWGHDLKRGVERSQRQVEKGRCRGGVGKRVKGVRGTNFLGI